MACIRRIRELIPFIYGHAYSPTVRDGSPGEFCSVRFLRIIYIPVHEHLDKNANWYAQNPRKNIVTGH